MRINQQIASESVPQHGKLTAGHIEERAVNGGDPEVGGAGVKKHSEVLWRGADADHPVVLGLRRQYR